MLSGMMEMSSYIRVYIQLQPHTVTLTLCHYTCGATGIRTWW